jgi:phosphatidate cytidylyltransferase
VLFGVCLGHLGYFANFPYGQPLLLAILLCVEMNDIFAYCTGKLFGRRKLAPQTSPNKTLGGALGALVLTSALFAFLLHCIFRGTPIDTPLHLATLGVLLSLTGQWGDLVMSSIKRDLGIKDMAALIPGHGGLLDRFDSLLFVGPALFHYLNYFGAT